MALLFSLFESFLAGTSNHSFIWVYPWWGVLPVFVTTYIPFFLASNYIPDMKPEKLPALAEKSQSMLKHTPSGSAHWAENPQKMTVYCFPWN